MPKCHVSRCQTAIEAAHSFSCILCRQASLTIAHRLWRILTPCGPQPDVGLCCHCLGPLCTHTSQAMQAHTARVILPCTARHTQYAARPDVVVASVRRSSKSPACQQTRRGTQALPHAAAWQQVTQSAHQHCTLPRGSSWRVLRALRRPRVWQLARAPGVWSRL